MTLLYLLLFIAWCLLLALSVITEREKENGSVGAAIISNAILFFIATSIISAMH